MWLAFTATAQETIAEAPPLQSEAVDVVQNSSQFGSHNLVRKSFLSLHLISSIFHNLTLKGSSRSYTDSVNNIILSNFPAIDPR